MGNTNKMVYMDKIYGIFKQGNEIGHEIIQQGLPNLLSCHSICRKTRKYY